MSECLVRLTKGELEVAILLGFALENRQIAESLHLSLKTVKGRIGRILDKGDFANRNEVAVYVARLLERWGPVCEDPGTSKRVLATA
jgi:DNA-binding NarL/FixJ family response regulator